MADGHVEPGTTEGLVCEQCALPIPENTCVWLNPATQKVRHPRCRPMKSKQIRTDGRYGRRARTPNPDGSLTPLELAEVALSLEDLPAAKAYAQVSLARSLHKFLEWLQEQEDERWGEKLDPESP